MGIASHWNLRNAELIQSVGRLADALPFYNGSPGELAEVFIHAAGDNFRSDRISEIPHDVFDLGSRIIEYSQDLIDHASTNRIADVESLIADFIWFLTKPLNVAERDVSRLELSSLAELSQHEALRITNIDFRAPAAACSAVTLFGKFIEDVRSYRPKIDELMRRVRVLERIFNDPEEITLRMRSTLYDISGMIAQLDGAANMVLKSGGNDILRARWLESLHSVFEDRMDPFSYVRKAHPDLTVTTPKQKLVLPTFLRDTMRQIMNGLMQNAIESGAQRVAISVLSNDGQFATIGIMGDGPGIAAGIKDQQGTGLYMIKNHLVPKLGQGAAIAFKPPADKKITRGTIVELKIPLKPKSVTETLSLEKIGENGSHFIDPIGGDESVAPDSGMDNALAGAFGLVGDAKVIPLRFGLKSKKPTGDI
jgi:hypothetical protein